MQSHPTANPADDESARNRVGLWTDAAIAVGLILLGLYLKLRLPHDETASGFGPQIVRDAHDLGLLLILAGFIIPALRILNTFFAADKAPLESDSHDWSESLAVLALPAGLALYFIYEKIGATKTATIAGERTFWLDDDMMISMRYAKNLASGHGLVWNPGQDRVEGYSNFLWTLVLSLPHFARFPMRLASAEVLVINAGLALAVLFCVDWAGRRLGLSPAARFLAVLLVAANRWFIYWTVGGSESILMALVLLVCAVRFLSATEDRPISWGAGLLLGLIPLIRADGLVLLAGFSPAIIYLFYRRVARWPLPVTALALPAMHFAFRKFYYGEWLPNTYLLKVKDIPLKEAMGAFYIFYALFSVWMGICVLQFLSLRLGRTAISRILALVPWAGILYALIIGGDELPESRFFVPLIPLLVLGAVLSVERIFLEPGIPDDSAHNHPSSTPAGSYAWIVLLLALCSAKSLCLPNVFHQLGVERGAIEQMNVRLGLLLRDNTKPEALIAHYWAGAAPYFSERPAHDMLGKSDAHIAAERGHAGQWEPGHTKYDPQYTMRLLPDVIVTALPSAMLDPAIRKGDPSCRDYPSLCSLYDDAVFRALYSRSPVPLVLSNNFHAIFVRRDSENALPAEVWTEP